MKEFLLKYWLIGFVICNVCSQYHLTSPFANALFYFMQAMALICTMFSINALRSRTTIKTFPFVYWYALILIVYQFTFGFLFISEKTWTYLLSKIIVDFAIIISLAWEEEYYEKSFYRDIAIMTSILLLFGYFTYNPSYGGRQTLGFWNPNSTGSISAICFGVTFIIKSINAKVRYAVATVCLLGVLLSGSRSAMGIVVISLFINYGINPKLIGIIGILTIIALFVLPALGIEFIGISRFADAFASNDFASGRETERESTLYMIKESPWIGNGIYSQQDEEASRISTLGSHNAYLDFIKWFGFPLGLLIIGVMIYYILRLYLYFRNSDNCYERAHLFVLISVLLAANYEAYIWGVNQMITTMFFLSFSFLQRRFFYLTHETENK